MASDELLQQSNTHGLCTCIKNKLSTQAKTSWELNMRNNILIYFKISYILIRKLLRKRSLSIITCVSRWYVFTWIRYRSLFSASAAIFHDFMRPFCHWRNGYICGPFKKYEKMCLGMHGIQFLNTGGLVGIRNHVLCSIVLIQ